jgi:hypothetical protein
MVKIADGGSKMALLTQGENFQNVFTQASFDRTGGADICGTAVVWRSWRDLGTAEQWTGNPLGLI